VIDEMIRHVSYVKQSTNKSLDKQFSSFVVSANLGNGP
jgi:hypothetical protein